MGNNTLKNLTRRRFLKVMTLAGATAAVDWTRLAASADVTNTQQETPVVVIGSGLGGLVAAAYLTQHGFPVTLMEQHDRPGGYATAFDRDAGRFRFDVSLHATVAENAMPQKILAELGLWRQLKTVDTPEGCRVLHPEFDVSLPARNSRALVDGLSELFPQEKDGIQAFVQDMAAVQAEMNGKIGAESVMDRLEKISLSNWMAMHVQDNRLKGLLAALWCYYGMPPSRLNALYYAIATGEYLLKGGQYYQSRSQDLSDALMAAVGRNRGEVLMNTAVGRIGLHKNRVAWVEDSGGRRYPARAVVANVSPLTVFKRLLPPGALPAPYLDNMTVLQPSLSSCIVWLGLHEELRNRIRGYEIFISEGMDADTEYGHILAGNFQRVGLGVTIYDNLFAGYSRPGTSTMSIMSLCGYAPWRRFEKDYMAGRKDDYLQEKNAMMDLFIRKVENRLIPGLRQMIAVKEGATPLTNVSYTGNPGGAIYGFARSLAQLKALDVRTPVKGLYLAGAWTHGGGYTPVMMAGRQAAESLLADQRNGTL